MMSVLETEMEEKIGEIEHLRRELRQVQVRVPVATCIDIFGILHVARFKQLSIHN